MKRGSSPSRRILATGAAVCAHLLTLLALGWRIPRATEPSFGPEPPPLQLSILRPSRPAQSGGARRMAPAPRAQPSRPAAPAPSTSPATGSDAQPGPASTLAQGPADCEPEDLPLLTEAEKLRCRNQIDADKARRMARGFDERAAKQLAQANRGPLGFRMDADKEASFAPVVPHTYVQPRAGPGVACHNVAFPLLSGVDTNPDLFEKKHKQEHKATYDHAKCTFP